MQDNWRTKMKEQRTLKKEGAKLLHSRMILLMQIELDEEFIEWCDDNETNVYAELGKELAEIGYGYGVLKSVMEEFPAEAEWGKSLSTLIAEVIKKQQRPKSDKDRLSWKEIAEDRQKEIDRLITKVSALEAVVEEFRSLMKSELASK